MNDLTNSLNITSSLKLNVKFDKKKIQQILNITNTANLSHLNDSCLSLGLRPKLSLNPN